MEVEIIVNTILGGSVYNYGMLYTQDLILHIQASAVRYIPQRARLFRKLRKAIFKERQHETYTKTSKDQLQTPSPRPLNHNTLVFVCLQLEKGP